MSPEPRPDETISPESLTALQNSLDSLHGFAGAIHSVLMKIEGRDGNQRVDDE